MLRKGRDTLVNELFRGMVEANVRQALEAAKAAGAYDNSALRGRAREIFTESMLKPLLYPTMSVCTGTIIDGMGGQGPQTDVIVFDARIVPPLMLKPGEGLVPCESVLFAIEVKSQLTRQELMKSVAWASKIKRSVFHPSVAALSGSVSSIPCAVFAYSSDLAAVSTIADEEGRLHEVVAERNRTESPAIHVPLSAVTIATRGHMECIGANHRPPVWTRYASSNPTDAAMRFLSWVNHAAPALSDERATISLRGYVEDQKPA
jgi:hypothetical protein